jgi:G3E family GTPase
MSGTLPLYVLTGFLGSGKTTLLRRLLSHPEFADTAVIVNEFGDIGLDHDLLETAQEDVILLHGGCLCCRAREDLASTIRRLVDRRAGGGMPPFRRIVIETTGLADPVPVLTTLRMDPRVRQQFRLQGVIVTVDALHALETLARHAESVRQVALADRLVITKTDLITAERLAEVRHLLGMLNGSAVPLTASHGELTPALLLGELDHDLNPRGDDAERWLGRIDPGNHESAFEAVHASRYRTIAWSDDRPVDWPSFGIWLTMLLHAHGDKVLRVKGILDVVGAVGPVVIHGVQHIVHPPRHLKVWPAGGRVSRLVFIVSNLPEATIRDSFEVFMRLSRVVAASAPGSDRSAATGGIMGGHPVRRRMAPAWMKG